MHGALPETPVLLQASPMQTWHARHCNAWDVANVAAIAAETDAGDYNVTWLSQRHNRTFLNHNRKRYTSYHFVDGDEGSYPRHQRRVAALRHALEQLWRENHTLSDTSHYVSAFTDDFVPSLAQTLTEWLPAGCLRDDRFTDAGAWDEAIPDYSTLADCRNLNSVVWFGQTEVGTSTHYDVSHNLFFQLSGKKRFDLIPPSAHRALQLFPFWHGSNRQAQAPLPFPFTNLTWRADLHPGDVLLLPSRWFHRVESLSPSIVWRTPECIPDGGRDEPLPLKSLGLSSRLRVPRVSIGGPGALIVTFGFTFSVDTAEKANGREEPDGVPVRARTHCIKDMDDSKHQCQPGQRSNPRRGCSSSAACGIASQDCSPRSNTRSQMQTTASSFSLSVQSRFCNLGMSP